MPIKAYEDSVSQAYKLFRNKKYSEAAHVYSRTFELNGGMGKVIDRYRAASCWALINNADSAFFNLDKLIRKGKFPEFDLISNDYNLIILQKDPRWKPLMDVVKQNQEDLNLKRQ